MLALFRNGTKKLPHFCANSGPPELLIKVARIFFQFLHSVLKVAWESPWRACDLKGGHIFLQGILADWHIYKMEACFPRSINPQDNNGRSPYFFRLAGKKKLRAKKLMNEQEIWPASLSCCFLTKTFCHTFEKNGSIAGCLTFCKWKEILLRYSTPLFQMTYSFRYSTVQWTLPGSSISTIRLTSLEYPQGRVNVFTDNHF